MSSRDDLVKVVLANDGGTCHGFGKMHCFNDPAAKWDGRRCNECKDWAERILRSVEDPIRADEREPFTDLADAWTAEAARYRRYAEGSPNPNVHKSIALTLKQCANAVFAVGAGVPEGSRLGAGTETSVQPDAIGPDTRSLADLRAQVDALRVETWDAYRSLDYAGADMVKRALATRAVVLQDVLAIIDGGGDE